MHTKPSRIITACGLQCIFQQSAPWYSASAVLYGLLQHQSLNTKGLHLAQVLLRRRNAKRQKDS